jgi:hypothetical protein
MIAKIIWKASNQCISRNKKGAHELKQQQEMQPSAVNESDNMDADNSRD